MRGNPNAIALGGARRWRARWRALGETASCPYNRFCVRPVITIFSTLIYDGKKAVIVKSPIIKSWLINGLRRGPEITRSG